VDKYHSSEGTCFLHIHGGQDAGTDLAEYTVTSNKAIILILTVLNNLSLALNLYFSSKFKRLFYTFQTINTGIVLYILIFQFLDSKRETK
jgi:hypothetical protein